MISVCVYWIYVYLQHAQQLLTEFREQLITTKSAKEHFNNKLNIQITLLKDQQIAAEMEWRGQEELLNQEISSLQEKYGK